MLRWLILVLLTFSMIPTDAEAFIFRRWRRVNYYSYSGSSAYGANPSGVPTYYSSATYDNPQAAAEAKAQLQANRNACFHPGGGFGGCTYEGVGSGPSAAIALSNCCWTGRKRLVAEAVYQGSGGYFYACRLFVD